jgi:DNA-binding NarL/FixJ family response regulator
MLENRVIPFALIVEDHPLVADSLVACVRDCDAELEVITAQSVQHALAILMLRPAPVLIVTDLTLTDVGGVESVRRLREAAPQSPLLVFTALDDPALRTAAKELGATAYLIKSASVQALRDHLRAVIHGSGKPTQTSDAAARVGAQSPQLTKQQRAVLEELVAGRPNKEIAVRLEISDKTVNSHLKEIFGRLGVRNRTEAVVRYLQIADQYHDRARP